RERRDCAHDHQQTRSEKSTDHRSDYHTDSPLTHSTPRSWQAPPPLQRDVFRLAAETKSPRRPLPDHFGSGGPSSGTRYPPIDPPSPTRRRGKLSPSRKMLRRDEMASREATAHRVGATCHWNCISSASRSLTAARATLPAISLTPVTLFAANRMLPVRK